MKRLFIFIALLSLMGRMNAQTEIVVGDMNNDGKLTIEDVTLLTNAILANHKDKYIVDGNVKLINHDYVDLGLPSGTLWATCNVGANSPEEYGDYFAWGETSPQDENTYDWTSYKLCNGTNYSITKYGDGHYGVNDGLIELEDGDDAAFVIWGNAWETPSLEQMQELINEEYVTISLWYIQNNTRGTLITSKVNGNSLFLPNAGGYFKGQIDLNGSEGEYWTSTLNKDCTDRACRLSMRSDDAIIDYYYQRFEGHTIRPVLKK